MRPSASIVHIFLGAYKGLNKTGLMDAPLVRKLFYSSYFLYKKFMEDPFHGLSKRSPQLFQNGNILDIGANIGYTSYVFSKVLSPSYKIYAFEPESQNFKSLQDNVKARQLEEKVIPIQVAVGERSGTIDLWQNDDHRGDHRVMTTALLKNLEKDVPTQRIPLTTIDTFLKSSSVQSPTSFIKIDVQGYEIAVCNGMTETLKNNPNVTVVFEYCPELIVQLGFNPETLLTYFKDLGFNFYILQKNGSFFSVRADEIHQHVGKGRLPAYLEILCSRNQLLSES